MLDVSEIVVPVDVNTVDLHLVARAGDIDQVVKDEDFFLARNAARRHRTWSLLNGQLLIVAVDSLDLIYGVWAASMAHDTLGQALLGLLWVRVEDGSLDITALAAEVHASVLWEYMGALGHDTAESDKSIQMDLAQLSELVLDWELADSYVDLLVEVSVVWVNFLDDLACHSV